MRRRRGDQPLPTPNDLPYIQDLVEVDMAARRQIGFERYGQPGLQAHNGRDMMRDAYEEAMDLVVYIRGVLFERDGF